MRTRWDYPGLDLKDMWVINRQCIVELPSRPGKWDERRNVVQMSMEMGKEKKKPTKGKI